MYNSRIFQKRVINNSKKMGKGFAILAVLGAVALAVFSYAKTATNLLALKAQFNGLKVHKVSLTEIICKVNLAIVNPNKENLVANQITGNVIYKGDVISTINWSGTLSLAGNNQTTNLNGIQFNIKNLTLVTLIYKLANGSSDLKFTLNARITAGGNTYPVETTLNLNK